MSAPAWTSRQAPITLPRHREDVALQVLDGEVLVTHPDGTTFHMNQTARRVWSRCDGRATTSDVAHELVAAYDVDLDIALDDVEEMIVWFHDMKLVHTPR